MKLLQLYNHSHLHTLLPTLAVGLGAVVAFLLTLACSNNATPNDSDTADDSLAFHIAILPTRESTPFVVAQQRGMFEHMQIEVKLDTFLSAMDADTAFMNGHVQMMVTDTFRMAYLNTITKNETVKPVITDTLYLSMLTTPQSRIRSTKSLKDKIVAVTRNSAIDHFADRTMQRAGMKPEELNRPQINDILLRTDMLNLSQYDGAILPEPFATQCEEKGAKRIAMMQEPQMRVVVKSNTAKTYKDTIDEIVAAYWKAKDAITKPQVP